MMLNNDWEKLKYNVKGTIVMEDNFHTNGIYTDENVDVKIQRKYVYNENDSLVIGAMMNTAHAASEGSSIFQS